MKLCSLLLLLFLASCATGPNPYQVVDQNDPWHTRSFPLYRQNQNQPVYVNVYNYITAPREIKRTYRKEVIDVPNSD